MINKKLFKEDYFLAWKIRKKLVEIYKRCYSYCVKNNLEHNFDQYGYIKKESRYITIDELEPLFSMVEHVSLHIAEIRGLQDKMLDRDKTELPKNYNPNLMNAMFPHVHWAYYCMKHDLTKDERLKYYNNMISKHSEYQRFIYTNVEFPKIYHRKWKGIDFLVRKAEELLKSYGETDLITGSNKHKIVFFTGSGISQESGIPTFRDNDGLWEQYPVEMVASAHGWYSDPMFVNEFFNKIRQKYVQLDSNGEPGIVPNSAHKNIARLGYKNQWNDYDNEVVIITQNVDDLHEKAVEHVKIELDLYKKPNEKEEPTEKLSVKVIHLHGELMKMCADGYKENKKYHVQLPYNGSLEFPVYAKVKDIFHPINVSYEDNENKDGKILINEIKENWDMVKDKLMRPYVVFFGEDVPNMGQAISEVETCDAFIIIGTSLQVYPAANLIEYVPQSSPIIYIDPNPTTNGNPKIQVIKEPATSGMTELLNNWKKYVQ